MRNVIIILVICTIGVVAFLLNEETKADSNDVREETSEAWEAIKEYSDVRFEELQNDMSEFLRSTKKKFNELVGDEEQPQHEEVFDELKKQVTEMRKQVANNKTVQESLDKLDKIIADTQRELAEITDKDLMAKKLEKSLEKLDKTWKEIRKEIKAKLSTENK